MTVSGRWRSSGRTRLALIVVEDPLADMSAAEFCRRARACPQGADAVILVITSRDDDLPAVLEAGATDLYTTSLGPACLGDAGADRRAPRRGACSAAGPGAAVPAPLRVGRRGGHHLGPRWQLQGGQRRVPPDAGLHARGDARGQVELGGHLAPRSSGPGHRRPRAAPGHGFSAPARARVRPQGRPTHRGPRRLGGARRDDRVHQLRHRHLGEEGRRGGAAGVGGAVPRAVRALPVPEVSLSTRRRSAFSR